ATACVRKYGPLRLVATSRSKLSSPASRMSARWLGATPALFTSTRRPLAPLGRRDVGAEVAPLAAQRAQRSEWLAKLRLLAPAAQREVEPFRRERAGHAEPDAARAAGDERDAPHAALPGP